MKKVMATILCLMMSLSFMGTTAFAAEDGANKETKTVTVHSTDLEGNLLAIDGVPVNGGSYDGMTGVENIRPYNAWGVSQENTKYVSRKTKYTPMFTGKGSRGGTIKMHTSFSYSTTLSGGLGISAAEFNANMGFSTTASITLGVDYDYYVKAKRAEITAYPVIYKYTFNSYFLGVFKGSGTAYVPRGVDYVVTNYN